MNNSTTKVQSLRKHLYEIDFMRVFFTFGVLFNHTVNKFTIAMTSGDTYNTVRSLRVMFHYTRMGFIFISGVVLTLTYFNRNDWPRFFKKRFNGSIWPYLAWNALLMCLMILVGKADYSFNDFGNHYLTNILHGSSFYLYYMLLVMQLYLFFPIVVWIFKRWQNSHVKILATSFILQLIIDFGVKFGMSHIDTSNWLYWFKAVSINIFAYQFYIFLGVFAWLHHQEVYSFLNNHIKLISCIAVAMALGMIAYYRIWNLQILGLSDDKSLSLHQPYIICYDIVMLGLIFWIGKKYAAWQQRGLPRWLETTMNYVVKVSFGMYLNQTLGLLALSRILSSLNLSNTLLFILIPVGWLFVIAVSFLVALFCYKVPPFGFLIGRPNWHPFKKGIIFFPRLSSSDTK